MPYCGQEKTSNAEGASIDILHAAHVKIGRLKSGTGKKMKQSDLQQGRKTNAQPRVKRERYSSRISRMFGLQLSHDAEQHGVFATLTQAALFDVPALIDNGGCSDFLGRVNVPAAVLLHSPSTGESKAAKISIPLVPLSGPEAGEGDTTASGTHGDDDDHEDGGIVVGTINQRVNAGEQTPNPNEKDIAETSTPSSVSPAAPQAARDGAGAAGRFARNLVKNIQHNLATSETISGTLTLSLELVDDSDGELDNLSKTPGERGGRHTGRLREPPPPKPPVTYGRVSFKIAEDIAAERRRREKEGIDVPRMLSRVEALQRKLGGLNEFCTLINFN